MEPVFPDIGRILLLIAPILLIQLALAIYGLVDLARRKVVRGPRGLWLGLLIISAISFPMGIIISGLYLAWGRNVEQPDDLD
ncbi:MAG: hypothetical protein MUC34_02860 [Anaerolineae bacterium]|jgi:hypothetical protein|nr:hypothetical protein [Anaerolineae bacterium]